MKNQSLLTRLGFATSGIVAAYKHESSFRAQLIIGIATGAATAILRPGLAWAAMVFLAMALVLALELVNSAFECLIDHLHPERAPEIKLAKDIAAGAVLIATIGAVAVGFLMIVHVLWL